MTKNRIKINKACGLVSANILPNAQVQILNNIPEEITSALTSKQLAALIEAMNNHYWAGWKEAQLERSE